MTVGRWLVALLAGAGVFALVSIGIFQIAGPVTVNVWGLIGILAIPFLAGTFVTGRVAGAHSLGHWALAAILLFILVFAVIVTLVQLVLRGFT